MHRLLTGLAATFDVTFLTFEHRPTSSDVHCPTPELRRLLDGVEVLTVPGLGGGKRVGQARSLFSERSWEWGRYRLAAFEAAVRATVARRRPQLAHFDDIGVAAFGPVSGATSSVSPHNVEHRILRGVADASRGPRRLFAQVEWRKVRREEVAVWRRMPLCLAVSEVDAAAMRAAGARRVELCPNGTDPVAQLPPPLRSPDEPLRILFVGSGSYQPYERGLAWFVREVLPRVQERVPASFDVVGSPPRHPVKADGVRYVGRVESLERWYSDAHAVVIPVFEGSGTRLKVLEAMAYGRPVVSTSLGAEGLPIRSPDHYLEADDAIGFTRALLDVSAAPSTPSPRLTRMLADAREAVAPLFWPNIVAALADLYRGEIEQAASGARAL